jgi:hypothetical protein
MQSTESRQGNDLASDRGCRGRNSTAGSVLTESEVSPIFVIQVDNATPIVLNREKSVTLGILGTTAGDDPSFLYPEWACSVLL